MDTIQIAQDIHDSDANGKNLNWHPENIPKYAPLREKIEHFKEKFGKTPNVILKNFLDEYLYSKNLTDLFKSEGKPFYTQKINSFTWACISPKIDKNKLRYRQHSISSQCPQLYVLIDENGIEFGFDYGSHINNDDIRVRSIKSHKQFLNNLFELTRNIEGLDIYENIKLNDQNEQIDLHSPFDLKEKWSKNIRILHIFPKSNIPSNLDEQIKTSLDNLLFVFIFSSLIKEWTPEKISDYLNLKEENAFTSISLATGEVKKSISYKKFEKDQEMRDEKARLLSDEELFEKAKLANATPVFRMTIQQIRLRNSDVSEYAKRRANGKCQLCNLSAPFNNIFGSPYLETHHIDWLSKDGLDTIENTVALCPNCHKKMHILDLPHDREVLKDISSYIK